MARWISLLLALLLKGFSSAFGANVSFFNLQFIANDRIGVHIRWESGWNLEGQADPGNFDAVWLFGKWRTSGGNWAPLHFSPLSTSHIAHRPDSVALLGVPDEMGILVRTQAYGGQAIVSSGLDLLLSEPLPEGNLEVSLMGIEMVWIPEGNFWVGDGASNHHLGNGENGAPFWVNTSGTLPVGPSVEMLGWGGDIPPGGDIPSSFPKGHGGFFCMKHEISQAQYGDFLNHLTFSQQGSHMEVSPDANPGNPLFSLGGNYRNGLRLETPGVSPNLPARIGCDAENDGDYFGGADGGDRAMNYLSWEDLLAYLDWAGLRPLSELEFEKACRGPQMPLPWEYAWGSDLAVDANTPLLDGTNQETVSETAGPGEGLCSHGYMGPQGPLRSGFGANAYSNRGQAGAGYWGVLELSGNLWEQVVGLQSPGLTFQGTHGDGILNLFGQANPIDWPPPQGAGYRGGAWNSGIGPGFRDLAVSDRFYMNLPPTQRRNTSGGRGGRSYSF